MEAAEAKMIEDPMNQKALDRLLEAQATYEAVGGLTQDRLVAQVRFITNFRGYICSVQQPLRLSFFSP